MFVLESVIKVMCCFLIVALFVFCYWCLKAQPEHGDPVIFVFSYFKKNILTITNLVNWGSHALQSVMNCCFGYVLMIPVEQACK